jgi:hypothetical protein
MNAKTKTAAATGLSFNRHLRWAVPFNAIIFIRVYSRDSRVTGWSAELAFR